MHSGLRQGRREGEARVDIKAYRCVSAHTQVEGGA